MYTKHNFGVIWSEYGPRICGESDQNFGLFSESAEHADKMP